MDLGFEASKGAAERVLGVKLPILMRLILPGLLATAVLYPAVAWMLGHFPVEAERFWERIAGYAVLVLLLGALISTTNSEIYKVTRAAFSGLLACGNGESSDSRLESTSF